MGFSEGFLFTKWGKKNKSIFFFCFQYVLSIYDLLHFCIHFWFEPFSSLQIISILTVPHAYLTRNFFLTNMSSLIPEYTWLLSKRKAAHITRIWLFATVCLHVIVCFLCKRKPTYVTRMFFHQRVYTYAWVNLISVKRNSDSLHRSMGFLQYFYAWLILIYLYVSAFAGANYISLKKKLHFTGIWFLPSVCLLIYECGFSSMLDRQISQEYDLPPS